MLYNFTTWVCLALLYPFRFLYLCSPYSVVVILCLFVVTAAESVMYLNYIVMYCSLIYNVALKKSKLSKNVVH